MESSEIFYKIKKAIISFNKRINAIVEHSLYSESQILTLVTILEERGILSFDEFDKRQEEIEKHFIELRQNMRKKNMGDQYVTKQK